MSTYNYTISIDTLNGVVNNFRLIEEIEASTITIALSDIQINGDALSINFKAALSTSEQTTLTSIVNGHSGEALLDPPTEVALSEKTPGGTPLIAVKKADGSGGTKISHDWTDPCTWYKQSTRVTGETLTLDTGLIYDFANQNVIDLTHGRHTDEDDDLAGRELNVYDNGVELVEDTDYTMNYESGKVTLNASPTGPVTADYSYASGSAYIVGPDAGKVFSITRAELQFSKDVIMNGSFVDFEIWVYNPYDLPNKFLYKRKRYKNIKDIINGANLGQGVIPAIDGLTNDVLVFPFDYVTTQDLTYSTGAELRIRINNDTPFSGEWATVTIYYDSHDEV